MNPTEVMHWIASGIGLVILVALPPLLWQKFGQLLEERAALQEQMQGNRETQERNRRMEKLCALDRKLNIRWQRRRDREERERDERGYS
jgi:hypothetical protein